ncbi:hypothetical protein H0H87_002399 [Tephrocybe sp. NHM501043]|nr:hypothetical protein H0H87_002399 [Tephrocybe sp. NHM501043]
MDIRLYNLPYGANKWTVTRSIASVVHSKEFTPRQRDEHAVDRPINFGVRLHPSKAGGVGNDGTGILTMPTKEIGYKFLKWVEDSPLKIEGKRTKFRPGKPPRPEDAATLDKTPYADPDIEEEHQQKLWDLSDKFRVHVVQFGIFYRSDYPKNDKEALKPRAFSVEWERRYDVDSEGWLTFEYDHKLIRITVSTQALSCFDSLLTTGVARERNEGSRWFKHWNQVLQHTENRCWVRWRSLWVLNTGTTIFGSQTTADICFDTLTPPVFEEIEFHRSLTGDCKKDNRKYKRRIGSINEGHKAVAPYAHHIRILLHNGLIDIAAKFKEMCIIAGLTESMIIRSEWHNKVEADRMGFFAPKTLYILQNEFKKLPWSVAFQLESLLRNGLLHTKDLFVLLKEIRDLVPKHNERYVSAILRQFNERLEVRSVRQPPLECFKKVKNGFTVGDSTLPRGNFLCSHVTFTPTRTILEGPYPTQSNRVIRLYEDFLDHFVRVDFRDEDRLQYRWDRGVDGSTCLQDRVGGILKNGFELAGRRFEFLAYSTSALREHAVWFMNPFHHPGKGWVNTEYIRQTLGDFKDTILLRQPSKYAARLAQAFTATDPSVEIRANEWEEVADLGSKPYLFTDGVGTISKSLGDRIWAAFDQFSIICYEPLLPAETDDAADYGPGKTKEIDRDSTVDDICDFIVEYIKSDVLGLLSDRLLVIADQSKVGIRDEDCLFLAQLCSQAVDYPKQGIPVDIDSDRLPRTLIRCKPDWHGAEVVSPRSTDYYESSRALGVLYRSITLEDVKISPANDKDQQLPLTDPISLRLKSRVEHYLDATLDTEDLPAMFQRYVDELYYICATHSLSNTPGIRLLEAEVVAGTILAKCSQKRWRKDRTYRMRLHASTLVRDVRRQIIEDLANASQAKLLNGLSIAWAAWGYSRSHTSVFGGCSFGLIALGVIFDCLDRLRGTTVSVSASEWGAFEDGNIDL